jgi:hypothetical protein
VPIASATRAELAALGVRDFAGLVPDDLLSWGVLGTLKGFIALVVGGFLVGFGTAWAGGCTSGRAPGHMDGRGRTCRIERRVWILAAAVLRG